MKLLLILSLILVSYTSWSKTTVIDPQDILGQTDTFIGGLPFAQAFRQGQMAKFKNKCLVDRCQVESEFTTMEVEYADEEVVMIHITKANLRKFPIIEDMYEYFNRNPLRIFINEEDSENLPSYDVGPDTKIYVNEITFTRGTVLGDAYPQAIVKTIQVTVDENGNEFEFPIDYTLTKGVPAIAQVTVMMMPEYYQAKLVELIK